MSNLYEVPNNFPPKIIKKICKPKIEIDNEVILEYLNFLKNSYNEKYDTKITELNTNLNEEKTKKLKKQLIKWRLLHYCEVLDKSIKNGHDLIMVNDPDLEIKNELDYYKNLRVYNSITREKISIYFQPSFKNSTDVYSNLYSVWSVDAYNKIVNCISEYINFLSNIKVSLRFKILGNDVLPFYYDEINFKELNYLRQNYNLTRIIGLSEDPRIKALLWYKNFFCKKTLEIIVERGRQRFIYKDTKQMIPEHLQPIEDKKIGSDIVYKCVIPKYTNDPRLDAVEEFNNNYDLKKKVICEKLNIKEIIFNKNKYFKRKRSPQDKKKLFRQE